MHRTDDTGTSSGPMPPGGTAGGGTLARQVAGAGPPSRRLAAMRHWKAIGLGTPVFAAIVLIVCGLMAGLGIWINANARAVGVQAAAETNAFYMDLLFEPLLEGLPRDRVLPPQIEGQLDMVLSEGFQDRSIDTAIIWWPDGTIAYSTDKSLTGARILSGNLERALQDVIVAKLIEGGPESGHNQSGHGTTFLEIYAPLHDSRTGQVIAVGEFYQDAGHFAAGLRRQGYAIWGVVGTTTALLLALLFATAIRAGAVVGAQQDELRRHLRASQELAEQNATLRRAADSARLDAFRINEDMLNRIGADLHDGPLQLMSLIVLRLRGIAPDRDKTPAELAEEDKTIGLATQTIQELRELSHGLVLPELGTLGVTETLALAAARHENRTGTPVETRFGDLPHDLPAALKICLYRIVQEALNNAFRHAGGLGQSVHARADGGRIEVVVSDEGPGMDPAEAGIGLGMPGLARRLQSFGGSLGVVSHPGGGTRITAYLPLDTPGP